jgi:hypothetical protein
MSRCLASFHLRIETDPDSETFCCVQNNIQRTMSRNSVTIHFIQHCPNHLELNGPVLFCNWTIGPIVTPRRYFCRFIRNWRPSLHFHEPWCPVLANYRFKWSCLHTATRLISDRPRCATNDCGNKCCGMILPLPSALVLQTASLTHLPQLYNL